MTPREPLLRLIWIDIKANRRSPRGILVTVLYRLAHACLYLPKYVRPIGWLYVGVYKFLTEFLLGTEIHWRAEIGSGLRVFHGYALVVSSNAVIGRNCSLRNGVTIGVKETDGDLRAPTLGDNVDVGASAILIGAITIGSNCAIGAGAVVVKSVPEGCVAVGNPARFFPRKVKQEPLREVQAP